MARGVSSSRSSGGTRTGWRVAGEDPRQPRRRPPFHFRQKHAVKPAEPAKEFEVGLPILGMNGVEPTSRSTSAPGLARNSATSERACALLSRLHAVLQVEYHRVGARMGRLREPVLACAWNEQYRTYWADHFASLLRPIGRTIKPLHAAVVVLLLLLGRVAAAGQTPSPVSPDVSAPDSLVYALNEPAHSRRQSDPCVPDCDHAAGDRWIPE
jgi:hypothetical protein